MNVIDLFSGAGGLSEGFARRGFHTVAFIEKEYWACQTLITRICFHWLKAHDDLECYYDYCKRANDPRNNEHLRNEIILSKYPELQEYLQHAVINREFGDKTTDVSTLSEKEAIDLIEKNMQRQGVDVIDIVVGGPPCQVYSIIGRSRMGEAALKDKRNFLFRYYLEIVSHFRPKLFVFENVPGLLSAHNKTMLDTIKKEFTDIGYRLLCGEDNGGKPTIHDISQFGVNQKRKRLILIGYNETYWKEFKYPHFLEYVQRAKEEQTTQNAISDLPPLIPNTGANFWYCEYSEAHQLSQYAQKMREDSIGVQNHFARPHRKDDLEIYRRAQELTNSGKQLFYPNLPQHLKHHKNGSTQNFKDRFRVHTLNGLPHTIVAHIAKDGHYNIHPLQTRSLTVREAARIQGFPDNYRFEGPRTFQYLQVGNAVPPPFADAIATAIWELL